MTDMYVFVPTSSKSVQIVVSVMNTVTLTNGFYWLDRSLVNNLIINNQVGIAIADLFSLP